MFYFFKWTFNKGFCVVSDNGKRSQSTDAARKRIRLSESPSESNQDPMTASSVCLTPILPRPSASTTTSPTVAPHSQLTSQFQSLPTVCLPFSQNTPPLLWFHLQNNAGGLTFNKDTHWIDFHNLIPPTPIVLEGRKDGSATAIPNLGRKPD